MKKLVLVMLAALAMAGSLFAETFTVNMYDTSNTKNVQITKNPYDDNFHADEANVINFTNKLKKTMPKPGDTVVVNYKFEADRDCEIMVLQLIDNSPEASYWLELGSSEWQVIENIKKGEIIEGSLTFEITTAAKKAIALETQVKDNKKLTLKLKK